MLALAALLLTVGHGVRAGLLDQLAGAAAAQTADPGQLSSIRKFTGIVVDLFSGVFYAMGFFSLLIILYNGFLEKKAAIRAIGADQGGTGIRTRILGYGTALGAGSAAAGTLAGVVLVLILGRTGLDVTALHRGFGLSGMGPTFPRLPLLPVLLSVLLGGLMGLLAAILPARDASRPA